MTPALGLLRATRNPISQTRVLTVLASLERAFSSAGKR